MAVKDLVNGVDVDKLKKTCEAIGQNADLAKAQFRVENRWYDGGHNQIQLQGYYAAGQEQNTRSKPFSFDADEPPALLGKDIGANPVEYLLVALSSCMTTSLVYHAAAKGVKIETLASEFTGDLDLRGFLDLSDSVPKGYQKIQATFKVKTDAPVEQLEGFYKFSPVYSMVSQAVPIEVKLEKV